MSDLTSMRNIGKEIARKLSAVGIGTAEQLRECGSKEAFFRLKTVYPQLCLVHLYALEGAMQDVAFDHLSKETKQDLKAFSDCLKG